MSQALGARYRQQLCQQSPGCSRQHHPDDDPLELHRIASHSFVCGSSYVGIENQEQKNRCKPIYHRGQRHSR